MSKKIIVLSGGFSEEKEISRISALEIEKELISRGYETFLLDPADYGSYLLLIEEIIRINADLVFIGLHGAEGEDGRIQALLNLHNIPFTGSDHRSSAIAMDKFISTGLVSSNGIPIPERKLYCSGEIIDQEEINTELRFPCVIKPNDSGSSVGISIVSVKEEIEGAAEEAFKYSDKILCEKFIPGRELTVTILDNEALPVVEIIPKNGWYDYTNKYTKGNTIYDTPAKLTTEETALVQENALTIFNIFGCKVYARVDFRYDGVDFYFLELNTLPGMTPLSLTPMAAKQAGLDFGDLLEKIIQISLNKFIQRSI